MNSGKPTLAPQQGAQLRTASVQKMVDDGGGERSLSARCTDS